MKKLLFSIYFVLSLISVAAQDALVPMVARPELLLLDPSKPVPDIYQPKPNFSINIPKSANKIADINAAWDIGVVSSSSPATFVTISQNLTVTCVFKNFGTSTVTSATLNYKWSGQTPVSQAWAGSLGPGASSAPVSFTTTVSAWPQGINVLKIWAQSPNGNTDALATNDTLKVLVWVDDPAASSSPYSFTGTDYWIGFMHNWDNGYIGCGGVLGPVCQKLYQRLIFTTLNKPATVTVTAPLASAGYTRTKTLAAYSVDTIVVPNVLGGIRMSTEISTHENISKTGIHVTSTAEINVYVLSEERYTTDGFLALPVSALGTDYIATSPAGVNNPVRPSGILIVAGEDGLQCTITNTEATASRAANSTWTTPVLNRGNTYFIAGKDGANLTTNADLTGTRIVGNGKKFAIVEGSTGPLLPEQFDPLACNYVNAVFEQTIPTASWGKIYYTTDFANKSGNDRLRVVSSFTGTTNYAFNGTNFTLVGSGKYRDHNVTGNTSVISDQPVAVKQMSTGGSGLPGGCINAGAGATNGDPFLLTIMPEEQWANFYVFTTPPSNFPSNYVNIIKKGTSSAVSIDGGAIPNGIFTQIGTTGFYAAQYAITVGDHTLIADGPFTAYVYGFAADDSYGYPASGASLIPASVPIKTTYFNGKYLNKKVELKWQTATETNSNYFEVERSSDGINFKTISSQIPASGNSSISMNYLYYDSSPNAGVNYYRFKQVDLDGKFGLSNMVFVDAGLDPVSSNVKVQPVPSKDNVNVEFIITDKSEKTLLKVVNITGQLVIEKEIYNLENGINSFDLDISSLEDGVYFIQMSNGSKHFLMEKMIKF